MSEERRSPSVESVTSSFSPKAPKLETRTLLQKFLDGRRTENPAGSICMDSCGNEPLLQSPKDNHTIVEAEESKMKVREDIAAAACGVLRNCQPQGRSNNTEIYPPWSPMSVYKESNEIYPYLPFARPTSVIQTQTIPNFFWGWNSAPSLPFQYHFPTSSCRGASKYEADSTTEKLEHSRIQKLTNEEDHFDLRLKEEDKRMVLHYVHKKFRRTDSSPGYQTPPRPSVIVSPQTLKEKPKVIDPEEVFDDILTASTFADATDFSDLYNDCDVDEAELADITSICELYFLEESISSHIESTQKDFFAEWTAIPLGEKMMDIYIDFCRGAIKMPAIWMNLAQCATRYFPCHKRNLIRTQN